MNNNLKELLKKIFLFLRAKINNPFKSMPKYHVLSIEETCRYIYDKQISTVRFGDGEMMLMDGNNLDHQCYDAILASYLKSTIQSNSILVCLPESLSNCNVLRLKSNLHWRSILLNHKALFVKYLKKEKTYGNAFITRPYLIYKDKSNCKERFDLLKKIWKNRNVLIIEGKFSCSGVGNDLLAETKGIKRIICPCKDAFRIYDSLLRYLKYDIDLSQYELILIALGCTAKPLVQELDKLGKWAIDIGHIDSEYEWFKRKATERISVGNKHTADMEVEDIPLNNDQEYLASIIKIFE